MTKYEELIEKLKVLFELNKADLDFGIHRIIKSRHREILRYLQGAPGYDGPMLKRKVVQVLGDLQAAGQEDESERLRAQIVDEFGRRAFNDAGELVNEDAKAHDLGQRWLVLQDGQGHYGRRSMEQLETEVYSHLLEFFGRYYEEGDFISLRRTRAGAKPYAIPYSGEEVVLHWANKDQYYIKSSEDLKDYTFTVEEMGSRFRVHFKCARMDPVANNNKAHRAFVLDEEAEIEAKEDTLVIPFYFKIFERKPTEKQQVEALEESLMAALGNEWKTRLNQQDTSYTGTGERTLLQKHLQNYTRKNTTDYFIHKDLGGFLKQELDFYIKNEVMYLDDVDNRPADYLTAEVRKIKAIRSVAKDLIDFLAQFENFQKRLWLKKKFVTECHYCITLDRIIEHAPELLPEIAANEEQRKEWVKLYAINEIRAEELGQVAYSEPLTVEFLRANPFLMVDTGFFAFDQRQRLLEAFDDLDSDTNGLLVHSENRQGIDFLRMRLRNQVKCIYIDPPYNTGEDEFIYKDNYMESSWLTMLAERLRIARDLLKEDGILFCSIDDGEYRNLWHIISAVFEKRNYLSSYVWKRRSSSGLAATPISLDHEYVLAYAKNVGAAKLSGLKKTEDGYPYWDELKHKRFASTDLTIGATREQRPNQFYPITNPRTGVTYEGNPNRVWRFFPETMRDVIAQDLVIWPDEFEGNLERPRYKTYFDPEEAKTKPCSSWIEAASTNDRELKEEESDYEIEILTSSMNQEGGRSLQRIFASKPFAYPKPVSLIRSFVRAAANEGAMVGDFFAGSGTTADAAIRLQREDGRKASYFLVELGDYFDEVIKPRIQKVVYSPDWRDGKPTRRDAGISHCFKYLRLESYEDTLNNLELEDRSADLLGLPADVQEDYLIRYMLDIETRGSLMNLQRFADPWGCTLKIYDRKTGEARPKVIDVVETFNYLLGLRVREQKVREGFLTVEGENPAGETVLVIWRKLSGESDWPTTDNAALNAFVAKDLRVNPADTEYAAIYINGDTTLEDPHKKILLTEQVFHELMFADTE